MREYLGDRYITLVSTQISFLLHIENPNIQVSERTKYPKDSFPKSRQQQVAMTVKKKKELLFILIERGVSIVVLTS